MSQLSEAETFQFQENQPLISIHGKARKQDHAMSHVSLHSTNNHSKS
jgi:hypothetical protein